MKFKWKIHSILTILLVLYYSEVKPQISKATAISNYLDSIGESKQFSGVVYVSYKGQLICRKSLGYQHKEKTVPNQFLTTFGIASVTKSMTRIIACQLADAGLLRLSDKLSRWIPDFPHGDQITLEMLLSHRSGLPHRATDPGEENKAYTSSQILEKAKHVTLEFEPGTRESYSSLGYSVMARVLELASGKTYAQLLNFYVFQPAGMNHSLDYNRYSIIPHQAKEYYLEPQDWVQASPMDYSFIVGAGSVFSTAGDLLEFTQSIAEGRYGQAAQKALIDSNGRFRDNGSTNGYRCFVMLDTKYEFAMVLVSNLVSGANDMLVRDLPKILQDQFVPEPRIPHNQLIRLSITQLTEYAGAYKFEKFTNHIYLENGQLFSGDSKIFATGADEFFRYADYARLSFRRDSQGKIIGLQWKALNAIFEGIRQ